MPNKITFRDYVRQGGGNEIASWKARLPPSAQAEFTAVLEHLENPDNWRDSRYVKPRKGKGQGLWELRFKADKVQYRPLVMKGPGSGVATLLLGATERDWKLDPVTADETAQNRKKHVESDPRRSVPHEW